MQCYDAMRDLRDKIGVLQEYVKSKRDEHVMDLWNNIMYANREAEFVTHLKHFETICDNIPLFVICE